MKTLHDCLQNDPSLVEAHVLAAVINNEAGNVRAANSSLQQAFSQDFTIRENPVFMLIKAQIEMRAQEWPEAKQTLESAFNLPGVKDGAP